MNKYIYINLCERHKARRKYRSPNFRHTNAYTPWMPLTLRHYIYPAVLRQTPPHQCHCRCMQHRHTAHHRCCCLSRYHLVSCVLGGALCGLCAVLRRRHSYPSYRIDSASTRRSESSGGRPALLAELSRGPQYLQRRLQRKFDCSVA